MKLKNRLLTTLGIVASIGFTSCSDKNDETSSDPTNKSESIDLTKFILKEEPADAVDIFDLRTTATSGNSVTFKGKIIGAEKVFIDDLAVMIMGDPKKLTSCDLRDGDGCQQPWDVCCDLPKDRKASILTVQILDSSGKPLKKGLKGLAGIKELNHLTITGVVDKSSTKDNMLINATGIFVQQ